MLCCAVLCCAALCAVLRRAALKLFVKLAITDAWLVTAVTGQKSGATSFQPTTLLTTLRAYVEQACKGELKVNEPSSAPE